MGHKPWDRAEKRAEKAAAKRRTVQEIMEQQDELADRFESDEFLDPSRRPRIQRFTHDRLRRFHRDAGLPAYLVDTDTVDTDAMPRVEVLFIGPADPDDVRIRERLGLLPGARVLARRRRYFLGSRVTQIATSYIPWDIAEGTPIMEENTGPGGIYARLEEAGHRLGSFLEETTARVATTDEAMALGMSTVALASPASFRSVVLDIVRTAYGGDPEAPVEVCHAVLNADLWTLVDGFPAE